MGDPLDQYEVDQTAACQQQQMQLDRAEYEVELARRRYEALDPSNRLVTAELESRWEQALRYRDQLQREAEACQRRMDQTLATADRIRVHQLAGDLAKVWHAPTTEMADR